MKTLIIIPAYNEKDNIKKVIASLDKVTADHVDYLVVNDCSKDNTESILKEMGANYVNLPVNLGIGGGVQTGYKYAEVNDYDIAIQIDGDGQHDPAYVETLIKPLLDDEADIVIGSRFLTKEGFQSSALRRFGINFLSCIIKICCGVKVYDVTSGFRAVNKEFIHFYAHDYAQDYPEPEAIIAGALAGARIKEVPVIMYERIGGESSISSFKSIYYMIKVSIAIIVKRLITQDERRKQK